MTREFNADRRAKERQDATVTIGSKQFHPGPRPNRVMEQVRASSRKIIETQRSKMTKLRREHPDFSESELSLELAMDSELEALGEASVIEQLRLLLVGDDGKPPVEAFLQEHLEPEDRGPLLAWLNGSEDDDANPPRTTTT